MKFKTFQIMGIGALTALGLGAIVGVTRCSAAKQKAHEDQAKLLDQRRQTARALEEQNEREARAQQAAADQLRREQEEARRNDPEVQRALALAARPVYQVQLVSLFGTKSSGKKKLKDSLGTNEAKLNIYAEKGIWARAKLDLDRDGKWDEKWRWADGLIYRKVARADDENYGEEDVVGEEEPIALSPPIPEDAALREVDEVMLEVMTRPVQAKIKDASKGMSFKINIYSDDGKRFNRAKVDLDRDDKWDEKWTFGAAGKIEREVSPYDSENYTDSYVLVDRVRWN